MELLTDYLVNRYSSYSLLNCGGWRYPVVVFPELKEKNIISSDRPPGEYSLDKSWKPKLVTKGFQFYWLMRSRTPSYNHDTFIMKSISLRPSVSMICGISDFFTNLFTSHSLELELLEAVANRGKKSYAQTQINSLKTPLRDRLHNLVNDPIKNGEGRASGIAISTLVAYHSGDDIAFLLR